VGTFIPDVITFDNSTSAIDKISERLRLFVLNQLQIYNYLKHYLSHSNLMEDYIRAGIEAYLDGLEKSLIRLEEEFKEKSENVVFMYDVADRHIKNGTKEAEAIKQYLLPEM
jgi:hypothetical protein